MLISDGAYSFLRGYLADIRDLNNVQLACNMIFGKKNKDSLYSYLVELRSWELDCWIESFQEFLDSENTEYADKFRQIYNRVQDRTILLYPDIYDMRPLSEYDAFPASKENAGEALEKGSRILENLAVFYNWGWDSRKDSIAAVCLIQFVKKTEIILENFSYYNAGFLHFIHRGDNQKYDFQDTDMLQSSLLSDTKIQDPELEEFELIISKYRIIGEYLYKIINNDKARTAIRKIANSEELRNVFYQTALFYKNSVDADELVHF